MGGILSATTGPDSPFGDDSFCEDFEPGFEIDDDFTDVDAAAGYGDVSPFSDSPFGGFSLDALQGLPTGSYEEFIPASSSSLVIPTAAAAGQIRLPSQLQLTPQQQQQQAALGAQQQQQQQQQQHSPQPQHHIHHLQQQQQQQQGLDFREQHNQWGPAAMEEQMRALMKRGG
ncbi:hypothetical protein VE04_08283, partial [Pseudogymnoascus sp. 24MN13]